MSKQMYTKDETMRNILELNHYEAPSFVLEILRSEVLFHVSSRGLPFSRINVMALFDILREKYRLELSESSELGKILSSMGSTRVEEIIRSLISGKNIDLEFKGGVFKLAESLVSIDSVRIHNEGVFVKVDSSTYAAESIAREILADLWVASGDEVAKEKLEKHILLKTYGTATKIDLGFPFEALLSRKLIGFVENKIVNDGGYINGMGSRSSINNYGPPKEISTSYNLDDLELDFHRFDKQTGRVETATLRIGVMTRSEQRTGIVFISSQMELKEHCELLSDLLASLQEDTEQGH